MNRTSGFERPTIPKAATLEEKLKRIHETRDKDDGYYNKWTSAKNDDDDDCEIFDDD